jgi:hypothetical protein
MERSFIQQVYRKSAQYFGKCEGGVIKWTQNGWTAKPIRNRQLYCDRYDNVYSIVSVHVAALSIDE